MSLDQELEGQSKFRAIVLGLAPDAMVAFGEVSPNGRYEVTIFRAGMGQSKRFPIPAEDLADLAKDGGGRRAEVEARLREILGER
jgi:hypothetical protein